MRIAGEIGTDMANPKLGHDPEIRIVAGDVLGSEMHVVLPVLRCCLMTRGSFYFLYDILQPGFSWG
jgi:hypothetical protein